MGWNGNGQVDERLPSPGSCLVRCPSGWVAQRDQLPDVECFFPKGELRPGLDDQHFTAEDAANDEALTLNGDHFVFLVEDRHPYFDAEFRS